MNLKKTLQAALCTSVLFVANGCKTSASNHSNDSDLSYIKKIGSSAKVVLKEKFSLKLMSTNQDTEQLTDKSFRVWVQSAIAAYSPPENSNLFGKFEA